MSRRARSRATRSCSFRCAYCPPLTTPYGFTSKLGHDDVDVLEETIVHITCTARRAVCSLIGYRRTCSSPRTYAPAQHAPRRPKIQAMNILFIHQDMPGQFGHLAAYLARNSDNRVVFLTRREGAAPPGV